MVSFRSFLILVLNGDKLMGGNLLLITAVYIVLLRTADSRLCIHYKQFRRLMKMITLMFQLLLDTIFPNAFSAWNFVYHGPPSSPLPPSHFLVFFYRPSDHLVIVSVRLSNRLGTSILSSSAGFWSYRVSEAME